MVTVGAIGLLLGAILAQYFRVFVLLPFCAAVLISAIALELIWGNSPAQSMVMGALAVVGVQLGYFLGLAIRQLIAALRHAWLTRSRHINTHARQNRRAKVGASVTTL